MYTASAGGDSSSEECGLQIDVGKIDGRARGKGAKITKVVEIPWKPGGEERKEKEDIQTFTSAPLPLTSYSEVSFLVVC